MRLTDMGIKALKAPEKGAQIYYDDTLTGFGVRVSEGGTKSFILTHGVRRQRETIGRVGIVSLQDARGEAKRRLAEYTLGKTKIASPSWAQALEEFLAEVERERKGRTHRDYARLLHKHFRFGETKLSDITPGEFAKKLDKLSDVPSEQHHASVVLHTFVRWAHRKHYLDTDPLSRMKSSHRYRPRSRILTDAELVKVWRAAATMGRYGVIVQLLILTGQRVGEISKLTRGMVEDDAITLPSWLTKNGREHRFPIGKTAHSILRVVCGPACPRTNTLLFPARGKPNASFNGFSKSKAKLDRISGVTEWTIHDLRQRRSGAR